MMPDRNNIPRDQRQHPKPCKCGKLFVYLVTIHGKKIPVNWDSLTGDEQRFLSEAGSVEFDRTRHKTHFIDCPNAKEFRKSK